MAITGCIASGHAQIAYWTSKKGFITTGTFSAWSTGRDASRGILQGLGRARPTALSCAKPTALASTSLPSKVLDKATLDKLDRDLQEYGVKTSRIPAGDLLETGERVRF